MSNSELKLDDNHFRCMCGNHAVTATRYEDYPAVEVEFWFSSNTDMGWRKTLRERLKACWQVIRTGNVYMHGVILTLGQAEKMGETLLRLARKEVVDE